MLKKLLKTLFITSLFFCYSAHAVNRALLIGIADYQGDSFDLEGPVYDIKALKQELQTHWQYTDIKTLLNKQASRENILGALTELKNKAKADDNIFIYFSGHGTSIRDKELNLPLPYSSGAIIPQDFSALVTKDEMLAKVIIGQRDLKPVLIALDKTRAHTFVAFDTCYSGNSVRGLFAKANPLPTREISLGLSIDSLDDSYTPVDAGILETVVYPYQNIFFLSASNSSEKASDIGRINLLDYPTFDNEPHGSFTDALLGALSGKLQTDINGDGQTNYSEMHTAIKRFMKQKGYQQEPQVLPALAEDKQLLRMRSVLGRERMINTSKQTIIAPTVLTVNFESDEQELTSKLKQLPLIQLSKKNADLTIKRQGNNYLFVNKSGDLLGQSLLSDYQKIIGRVRQEAWKKQFSFLLQRRASVNLDFSLKDSIKGSSAIEGELISFTLRSESPVYLLLLDIDAHGTLTTLYPYYTNELQPISANQLKYIPAEEGIKVQAPFGTDHLIAIGFSKKPAFLKQFVGKESLNLQSDLYAKLVEYLKTQSYGYNELDLLTFKK